VGTTCVGPLNEAPAAEHTDHDKTMTVDMAIKDFDDRI